MIPCVTLHSVTILLASVTFVSSANDAFNIELKQQDAEVYHEQSFGRNEFNYGYQVEKTNSQFQHKVKGPDDVTYGCYGYIDPVGEKHLVYYIADRLGYRLLAPDQPTKVFTDRVANSVNKLDAELQGRKLGEKVVAWNDLYLPSTCRRLNEIVSITPPPTPAVVQTTTVRNGGGFNAVGTATKAPTRGNVNGVFGGDQGNPNEDRNNAGAGQVQVPVVVESSKTGLTSEGADPIAQETSGSGLGVAEESTGQPEGTLDGAADLQNNGLAVVGGPNGVEERETGDSSSNGGLGLAQTTTELPTPEPTPPAKQIDPIELMPETTYIPISTPTTPTVVPSGVAEIDGAFQNCDHGPAHGPSPSETTPPATHSFNGFVFPINRNCDASGRTTADLLAQMQAINDLVLKVSDTLHSLVDATDRNVTCHRVLELLNIQQPVPLLVYVPIMLPYLDGGIHGSGSSAGAQKPPINPASYAYAKSCSECK